MFTALLHLRRIIIIITVLKKITVIYFYMPKKSVNKLWIYFTAYR